MTSRVSGPHHANVYVLGAGFGVDAGLPTVANFLSQMRDAEDWLRSEGRDAEREAVEAVLEFRHRATAAGYRLNLDLDNIEDLFSLAVALPEPSVSRSIRAAIAATLNYSAKRIRPRQRRMRVSPARGWPIPASWRDAATRVTGANADSEDVESSVYDCYASVLSGRTSRTDQPHRNVVISFNYDLLLEEALDRIGVPYDYGLGSGATYDSTAKIDRGSSAENLLLLKLHGSMNWRLESDESMSVFGSYEDARQAPGEPALVPPTWEKSVTGPTRAVWEHALHALSGASRLVIIGFSFRPSDGHFKYLLAAGLMENSALRQIHVVNPVASRIEPQIRSVLRGDQFEYGVIRLHNKELRVFLAGADDLKSIGRPMLHEGLDLVDLGSGYLERRLFLEG